jgi:hypothetical protein
MVDPGFAGVVDHERTLREAAEAEGRCAVTAVATEDALLDALEEEEPAEIFYFFCHGFTPGDSPTLAADALRLLREEAEKLPDHTAWDLLLNRLAAVPGEAKMFFGNAELTDTELGAASFFRGGRRPIVFLNMCHSADLLPAMGRGLARRFIDSDAAAVIGTECPMTAVFADHFARATFEALARGETVGMAVLNARRRFHAERNPLGFAYTLYGRADARLGATAAAASAPTQAGALHGN